MKRVGNILKPSNDKELGQIIGRAREMDALCLALRAVVAADSADAVVAANIREGGELVVLTGSPAWAARLRFETDRLIAAARAAGAEVETCSVRVARRYA